MRKNNLTLKIEKINKKALCLSLALGLLVSGIGFPEKAYAKENDETVTLRVCSWEEYIDEGDWEEDELIELPDADIIGENSLVDDFEEWYYETYGKKVEVEYSCFGTNEELYNMLTIGDVYDLVCPSEYMFMKLMTEGKLVPYSDEFFDESVEENYYAKGVSPFIKRAFEENEINGEKWNRYAAGYMWGVTGFLYNPDVVSKEEVSSWKFMTDPAYKRQITIKDNVRDSLFGAVGAIKSDLLTSEEFVNAEDYHERLFEEMNDMSDETLSEALAFLKEAGNNVYSFETDSGKADMITGKVVANMQWSGDAVYAMDQAEEDDYYLAFQAPMESTNLYFDAWTMLKAGIGEDKEKQHAAEAFVNFLSMPENAVRNMYYIGYTSVISGGESNIILDYIDWAFGAEEDEEDVVDYDLSYFFTEDEDSEDYVLTVPAEQLDRQLGAQYPSEDVIRRSAIMKCFDEETGVKANQMWINVRCFNLADIPVWAFVLGGIIIVGVGFILILNKKQK
ncbi:MAG: extracellular solute-binding protein [Lachnospiraceae bacterium]|nr:extracellular solute-binding protein [Lachnospiraceae bacterium]